MGKFKQVVIALTALALTGCGTMARGCAGVTGSAEVCHDGVVYIQFTSGATVKYNADGTIARCGGQG
jgi:hypothetical protein